MLTSEEYKIFLNGWYGIIVRKGAFIWIRFQHNYYIGCKTALLMSTCLPFFSNYKQIQIETCLFYMLWMLANSSTDINVPLISKILMLKNCEFYKYLYLIYFNLTNAHRVFRQCSGHINYSHE